jgi:hypothetical protein
MYLDTMLKLKTLFAVVPGIAAMLSFSSCVRQFYPEKIPCDKTSAEAAGIPATDNFFEFHRYRINYSQVGSIRIDHKFDRFYVVVQTRDRKTYSYFTHSQAQAENIYYLIRCKADL